MGEQVKTASKKSGSSRNGTTALEQALESEPLHHAAGDHQFRTLYLGA
jgi:hypothetical protein